MSAYRRSGHFLAASFFAEAVWRYKVQRLQFWIMDPAALGCGGGMVECRASRLRFWAVAVRRNSSRAPARPLSLSLAIERMCLASPRRPLVHASRRPVSRARFGPEV